MIALKEISIYSLKKFYIDKSKIWPECRKVIDWFEKHKINNYQELDENLNSNGYRELDFYYYSELRKAVKQVKIAIDGSNHKTVQPIYSFQTYSQAGIDLDLASLVDKKTLEKV